MSEPYVHVAFDTQGRKRDWFCEDVLVIIPKRHTPSLLGPEALDPALLVAMIGAVQKVAALLDVRVDGVRLTANAGAPGVTPHMHWHVTSPL